MGKAEYTIIIIIFNVFFIVFIAAIIVYIRQYRIKKKEHIAMLQNQKTEHQKEILSTQLEIQQQTMQHIGREIHDNIGQKLTLASLYTQQLAYENKAPQVNENIENIGKIINDSLSELRQLSKSLTDNTIETHTLFALLKSECMKINDLKQCAVAFTSNAYDTVLPYQEKSVLFRIAQEFLQNSIRHSGCRNITVTLGHTDGQLRLLLRDDGKGFDIHEGKKGIGISNMKKRTEIIGGHFELDSNNKGTRLTIEIPLA
ncbi:MAG TPA: sensor histidine kinase [Flavobacterium sp.]|nr:sensor histidine kinase [Flavobacterium sp.]